MAAPPGGSAQRVGGDHVTQAAPAGAPAESGTPAGPLSAVVVNPSKVVDLDERRREICAALAGAGWPEPLWLPTTPEDPGRGQAAEAVERGAEVVFACGGDGTVMAVAGTLAGTEVALAVLPSGTGNLLATNMSLPSAVADGVRVATDGARRRIDLGSCGRTTFTVMAGMGFDAQMIGGTSEELKGRIGWFAYVLAALRYLRHRPMRVRLRLDGGPPVRRRARTVLVGNVGRLQGGIPLLPDPPAAPRARRRRDRTGPQPRRHHPPGCAVAVRARRSGVVKGFRLGRDLLGHQAELVALRVLQHDPGPAAHDPLTAARPQPQQPLQLRRLVPVGRADVEVQPVLDRLGLV